MGVQVGAGRVVAFMQVMNPGMPLKIFIKIFINIFNRAFFTGYKTMLPLGFSVGGEILGTTDYGLGLPFNGNFCRATMQQRTKPLCER